MVSTKDLFQSRNQWKIPQLNTVHAMEFKFCACDKRQEQLPFSRMLFCLVQKMNRELFSELRGQRFRLVQSFVECV